MKLLKPEELANKLGVTRQTLRHWVMTRSLPVIKLSRKCIRFNPDAVDRWLKQQSHGL